MLSVESLLHPLGVGLPLLELLGRPVVRGPDGLTHKQAKSLDIVLQKNSYFVKRVQYL